MEQRLVTSVFVGRGLGFMLCVIVLLFAVLPRLCVTS